MFILPNTIHHDNVRHYRHNNHCSHDLSRSTQTRVQYN